MFKPRLSLKLFSAAIAQSVTHANEMLEVDHKIAVQRYRNDQFGAVLPPPPPLMIRNVKVKFSANVTKGDHDRDAGEIFMDIGRPDGNFSAEMEFVPFTPEMLRFVKDDGYRNIPFAAKTAQSPEISTQETELAVLEESATQDEAVLQDETVFQEESDSHEQESVESEPQTRRHGGMRPMRSDNTQGFHDTSDTPRNYGRNF